MGWPPINLAVSKEDNYLDFFFFSQTKCGYFETWLFYPCFCHCKVYTVKYDLVAVTMENCADPLFSSVTSVNQDWWPLHVYSDKVFLYFASSLAQKIIWVVVEKCESLIICDLKYHICVAATAKAETAPTWRMESSRDITAVSPSNNGGGDDIIEETIPDADSPSIRNRIACKTGHILNNLTSSVWYSYALLYLQNVVGLSALSVGIIFFISQTLMAVSFLVISFGHDKRLWKSFSPYGRRKARHIIGSAGVLLAWPFAFIPCLFCEDHSSNIKLGAYYLLSAALFSICWPLTEISYYSLMTEIRAENGKDSETSR